MAELLDHDPARSLDPVWETCDVPGRQPLSLDSAATDASPPTVAGAAPVAVAAQDREEGTLGRASSGDATAPCPDHVSRSAASPRLVDDGAEGDCSSGQGADVNAQGPPARVRRGRSGADSKPVLCVLRAERMAGSVAGHREAAHSPLCPTRYTGPRSGARGMPRHSEQT